MGRVSGRGLFLFWDREDGGLGEGDIFGRFCFGFLVISGEGLGFSFLFLRVSLGVWVRVSGS